MKEILKAVAGLVLLVPIGIAVLMAYSGMIIARAAVGVMGIWEDM